MIKERDMKHDYEEADKAINNAENFNAEDFLNFICDVTRIQCRHDAEQYLAEFDKLAASGEQIMNEEYIMDLQEIKPSC